MVLKQDNDLEVLTIDHYRLFEHCPAKYFLRQDINASNRIWMLVRSVLISYNSGLISGDAWSSNRLAKAWNKTAKKFEITLNNETDAKLHRNIGNSLLSYTDFIYTNVRSVFLSATPCTLINTNKRFKVYTHLAYRSLIEEEIGSPGIRLLYIDTKTPSYQDIVPGLLKLAYLNCLSKLQMLGPLISITIFNLHTGAINSFDPNRVDEKRAERILNGFIKFTDQSIFLPSSQVTKCDNCEVKDKCLF